jgi:hypothetical protein
VPVAFTPGHRSAGELCVGHGQYILAQLHEV